MTLEDIAAEMSFLENDIAAMEAAGLDMDDPDLIWAEEKWIELDRLYNKMRRNAKGLE
jgi:hypothetical protein